MLVRLALYCAIVPAPETVLEGKGHSICGSLIKILILKDI